MFIATLFRGIFQNADRSLSDRELADLGLSRVDYQHLVSASPGTRARMEALAAQFGVTPTMIDAARGEALEIAEVCGHCSNARPCQNALELGVDFDSSRCPNAVRYQDIASQQN